MTTWLVHLWPIVAVFTIALSVSYYTLAQSTLRPLGTVQVKGIPNKTTLPGHTQLSRLWGHYSPHFEVPSNISPDIPGHCQYTFVQLLSRHGSRFPTTFKSWSYKALIHRIKAEVKSFDGRYSFLRNYEYELGAEQLTAHGEREMSLSGEEFYDRYNYLTREGLPFIRVSGSDRIIRSAECFSKGYRKRYLADRSTSGSLPSPSTSVVISEEEGSNNTLSIKSCPAFLAKPNLDIVLTAKTTWAVEFVPPIRDRLNRDLIGANLTIGEVVELMDLCPFETVAQSSLASLSPFCGLFTLDEWHSYDYYQSLDKYYGHGMGNPLAPSLGVGFVNELIARLTHSPVQDETCTNHTLDSSNVTFPLDAKLYADFSHDNDMEAIFAALGLYNATQTLPLTSIQDAEHSDGFSAAWTVHFAARMYVEKMRCEADGEEDVRVLMNGRVVPLQACGADELGRCKLSDFVESLSFARTGGLWDRCFVS